jgi:hypothetical protein
MELYHQASMRVFDLAKLVRDNSRTPNAKAMHQEFDRKYKLNCLEMRKENKAYIYYPVYEYNA